jgi:pimeloyl-ACP methyl ester carboxylesterase
MRKKILSPSSRFAGTTYWVTGQGKPLLFIHGLAADHTSWKNQIEYFASRYQLILPDLPGSGESSYDGEPLQIDDMADAMLEIIQEEGLNQVLLFGHSMGGYIGLSITRRYPDKVKALGLVHSTSFADSEEKKQIRRKSIDLIRQYHNGKQSYIETMINSLYTDTFKQTQPQCIQDQLTVANKISSDNLVNYLHALMTRPSTETVLKVGSLPIFFLIGKKDQAIPYSDSLKQCGWPLRSNVHILEDCGHMGMIEEPKRVNEAIEKFCSYVLKLEMR